MGDKQEQGNIPTIAEERDKLYGDAWMLTSDFIAWMHKRHTAALDAIVSGWWGWAWLMILNKLLRAVATPQHVDTWKDIEGYARLVVRVLEGKDPDVQSK